MTPPAAPRHRHPSPQPSSTPLFLSPFLPRKRLFNTPNLRRKFEFPASRSRSREREDQQGAHHPTAPPPVKARGRWGRRPRKKLVLHNKSPMWNAASQVYQLDFGGRVTQESAKNFQIEYKDKTVSAFIFVFRLNHLGLAREIHKHKFFTFVSSQFNTEHSEQLKTKNLQYFVYFLSFGQGSAAGSLGSKTTQTCGLARR